MEGEYVAFDIETTGLKAEQNDIIEIGAVRLVDGKVEVLEFQVLEESACVRVPLRELRLRDNILISALIRGSRTILPNGSTVIMPGDHAIVVTAAGRLRSLDEILESAR